MRKKQITRKNYLTYGLVAAAYAILQTMVSTGSISATMKGMLVPICAYVVMALSLNLTVGVLGELSLGHAGFMSVGAFMGVTTAISLQNLVASAPLRLTLAVLVGALFAAVVGFLIGIPVLRLNGDYLAIVTLAFGEIIKSVFNNLYLGLDGRGFHVSLLEDRTNLAEDGRLIISGPMGIGGIPKIASFTAGALFALNYSTVVANKFDFNTSILVLVFVVFGGLGNMLGSIVAAAALTILPEALRGFANYRMLIYAIVLILVMLATNNPQLRLLLSRVLPKRKEAEGDA